MKTKKVIIVLCALLSTFASYGQKDEQKKIKEVIISFASAADNNDADKLSSHLDENYRVVMNRLFGSEGVSIMPRSVYLEKIRSKEFGGDERSLTFESININGETASAKVTLKGTKMTFISTFILVRNMSGEWKLISDIPTIA